MVADNVVPPSNWFAVNILAVAWGCVFATQSTYMSAVVVAGAPYAPAEPVVIAPLAFKFLFIGVGQVTLPFLAKWLGLKRTYMVGAISGAVGNSILTLGCVYKSFALICLGCCLQGVAAGYGMNYRFGCMLLAPSEKDAAAGRVLLGGVLGALIGPGVIARARTVIPDVEFAGTFGLCIVMHVIALCLLCLVRFPERSSSCAGSDEMQTRPRPLLAILLQPKCAAAVLTCTVAWVAMLLIMAPTPWFIQRKTEHSFLLSCLVMMIHLFFMFAPSPMTARMLKRFGPLPIIILGFCLFMSCSAFNLAGINQTHLCLALAALGLAWNFTFLAGTAMLKSTYVEQEGPKIQAFTDGTTGLLSGMACVLSVPIIEVIEWDGANLHQLSISLCAVLAIVTLLSMDNTSNSSQTNFNAKCGDQVEHTVSPPLDHPVALPPHHLCPSSSAPLSDFSFPISLAPPCQTDGFMGASMEPMEEPMEERRAEMNDSV